MNKVLCVAISLIYLQGIKKINSPKNRGQGYEMKAICLGNQQEYTLIQPPLGLLAFDNDLIYCIDLDDHLYVLNHFVKIPTSDSLYFTFLVGDSYYSGYYTNSLKYWIKNSKPFQMKMLL